MFPFSLALLLQERTSQQHGSETKVFNGIQVLDSLTFPAYLIISSFSNVTFRCPFLLRCKFNSSGYGLAEALKSSTWPRPGN